MVRRGAALLAGWLLCGLAVAQPPGVTKADEDVLKAGTEDPYTKGEPKLMARAGIVRYAPFPWADFKTTADLERVLGEGRFLWVETEHFRIGLNFQSESWPDDRDKRRHLKAEIKALRKQVPRYPGKPSELGPWERMHLYVHRLERLYDEVQTFFGVTDADFGTKEKAEAGNGPYLGLGDKVLVLLLQKQSDLARYFERFCDFQATTSMRWYHTKTQQMAVVVSAEVLEGFDVTALHSFVVYMVTHALMRGYRGHGVALPQWLGEGLAHHFAAEIPSDLPNVQARAQEPDPERGIGLWPIKVRRRAQHEGVYFTFDQMQAWRRYEELGYHAHAQSWSRVDFLAKRDAKALAAMVDELKRLKGADGASPEADAVVARTAALVDERFGLDAKTFDREWRRWVLKTYPKR
ncbi:MAG: hypothetical protein AAF628_28970 [Planctomycetota bacterium]